MGFVAVVEDEEGIRLNIMEILNLEGYESRGFANPAEFIEFCKNFDYEDIDLIISDIMMPVMTGIEMVIHLFHERLIKDIPVIFLTALGDEDTIETAYKSAECALFVDYIVKPFQIIWLISKVKVMTALKHRNDELRKANEDILATNLEIKNILETVGSENHYLTERLKSLLGRKNLEVQKKLDVVRDLMSKIAVNDLASLKFVAEIVERNQAVIEKIIREPTEEDEFLKILPKTAEPLRTAIWDIEQTIKLFVSLGIVDQASIDDINFEETSFYEILLRNYRDGGFSTEQFEDFIDKTRFKKACDNDIILF